MKNFFLSRQNAIDFSIIPALVRNAANPADFDLGLIFDRSFSADPVRQGFVQSVSLNEFWENVELAAK